MSLEQIRDLVEQNKDNQEVQNYLQGFSPKQELTLEGVQSYIEQSEDAKKWLQSQKDSHFDKGLSSWKERTLPDVLKSEVEKEITKRFPAETEEQKQLRELKAEIAEEKQARVKENLLNKATKFAVEKGLPVDVVDFFVAQDEQTTLANLTKFESLWTSHTEAVKKSSVEGVYKDNGRKVQQQTADPISELEQKYNDAVKSGNTALAIALKNRMFENRKE